MEVVSPLVPPRTLLRRQVLQTKWTCHSVGFIGPTSIDSLEYKVQA